MRTSIHAIVIAGLVMSSYVRLVEGAVADAKHPSEGKIVILPFAAANPAEPQSRIGESIRQGLLADLLPVAPGRVESLQAPSGDQAALPAARHAGAQYVVTGAFAISDDEVRLTAQVLDVGTGKAIAGIKATSPANQLFALEENVSGQLRRAVGLPAVTMQSTPGVQPQMANEPLTSGAWSGNDFANANPYVAGAVAGTDGSDFEPSAWGTAAQGYPLGNYIGPVFATGYRPNLRLPSNAVWNGSEALGLANSIDGVPMGALGMPSIAGGGPRTGHHGTGTGTSPNNNSGVPNIPAGLGMPSIAGGGGNNIDNIPPGGLGGDTGGGDFSFPFDPDSVHAATAVRPPVVSHPTAAGLAAVRPTPGRPAARTAAVHH